MAKGTIEVYVHSEKEALPFLTFYAHSPGTEKPNTKFGTIDVNLWEDFAEAFQTAHLLYKKMKLQVENPEALKEYQEQQSQPVIEIEEAPAV